MSQFDLNDIEEVETRPKKRNHNHHHAHNHTHNYNHDNNHEDNNNNNNNTQQDQSHTHHHHHHHRRRVVFMQKLGSSQYLLMFLFSISLFIIFFSFLINIILTVKVIVTPRIFMPSIIFYILSFMFSGGIIGTYVQPPQGRQINMRPEEQILLRYCTPLIMSIVTIVFYFFSLDNIHFLKNHIKKSQNICETNKGLTMEQLYNKYNKTYYELEQAKYDFIYLFDKKLVCYPNSKCIELNGEEKHYICNTDVLIKNSQIDNSIVKCDEINFDIVNVYSMDKDKDVNLFVNNCNELNKINLFDTKIKMFKCESKKNLNLFELMPDIGNIEEKYKTEIEKFYNKKINDYDMEMNKMKKMMNSYDNSDYSYYNYYLECYKSFDYTLVYFMINSYCAIYYFCSLCWVFFGLQGIYHLIRFFKNHISFVDRINNTNNYNNGDNILMMNNSEQYIELPSQYS